MCEHGRDNARRNNISSPSNRALKRKTAANTMATLNFPPCSHSSQRPLVVVAADVRDALRGRDCNGCLRTSAIPIQPTVSDCPCSFLSYLLPYACLCTSRLSTIGIAILYLSTSTSVPRTKLLRPVPTSRGPTQKHSEDQLSCAETSNRPRLSFVSDRRLLGLLNLKHTV